MRRPRKERDDKLLEKKVHCQKRKQKPPLTGMEVSNMHTTRVSSPSVMDRRVISHARTRPTPPSTGTNWNDERIYS